MHADKRNLVLLSDAVRLQWPGVPLATQKVLPAGVSRTEVVDPANADRRWRERRKLFFKPFARFGGRAAYCGDKRTQRVWQEILAGGYVAQALVAPGERVISDDTTTRVRRFRSARLVYDGAVQWVGPPVQGTDDQLPQARL